MNTNFKVIDLTRLGIKPKSTAPEAGTLTSRKFYLQVINFRTASPELPVPEMNLVLHRSSNFLVLSDIHRKVGVQMLVVRWS